MIVDMPIVAVLAVVFGTILLSMTFHEVMHGYVAFRLGDDTAYLSGRLTLNPLKHIDPFLTLLLPLLLVIAGAPPFGGAKPVPFNPARLRHDEYGAALVAIAGPLTNLVLGIIGALWLRFVIGFDSGIMSEILMLFVQVNLVFFIFNMIPIPPLDGSRVLYAFAPDGLRDFLTLLERNGLIVIAIIVIVFNELLSAFILGLMDRILEILF